MEQLNSHQEAIEIANASVAQSLMKTSDDPHRLVYHASPQVHWMNDPNGLIFFREEYHLFYQHNPYAPQWGDIHWGHMKSKDLVHWEHLPIALAPSEKYDLNGCYSGCAIEHEERIYLLYTSKETVSSDDQVASLQQQCVAISEDGIHFNKLPQNPIIPSPPEEIGQNDHFRDPKVWKYEDTWYMVLGTKKNERGKIILYQSQDLIHWDFISVLVESDGSMGHMYECPDLFQLNGKDVLIFSPEGANEADGSMLSGYYIGKFEYGTGHYEHGEFHQLDYGFDFYAPQTMADAEGRRILFGWMPMDGMALNKSWAGCMAIPRELRWIDGHRLQIKPVEEMKLLRRNHLAIGRYEVTDDRVHKFQGIAGDCVELIVTYDLQGTSAREFGLYVRTSEEGDEKTLIKFSNETKEIQIDRTDSGEGDKGVKSCYIEMNMEHMLTLHLFLDLSTLELFINQGDYVMSGFIFPRLNSQDIIFFSMDGSALIQSIDFWILSSDFH